MQLQSRLANYYLKGTTTWWRAFETYRSPVTQQNLYDARTDGRVVTKAKAWQSAHQYGLAVDFVALMPPKGSELNAERQWSWDSSYDWEFIAKVVNDEFSDALYMEAPEWDPGHVTHKMFLDYRTIEQSWRDPEWLK